MTDLRDQISFVRARLDARERQIAEDERVAREAVDQGGIGRGGEKHWSRLHNDRRAIIGDQAGYVVVHGLDETWSPSSFQAEHIARWDPARVLAEVERGRREIESKRRILNEAERYSPELEHGDNGEWAFEVVVSLMVQPYTGQPGWREEWAIG